MNISVNPNQPEKTFITNESGELQELTGQETTPEIKTLNVDEQGKRDPLDAPISDSDFEEIQIDESELESMFDSIFITQEGFTKEYNLQLGTKSNKKITAFFRIKKSKEDSEIITKLTGTVLSGAELTDLANNCNLAFSLTDILYVSLKEGKNTEINYDKGSLDDRLNVIGEMNSVLKNKLLECLGDFNARLEKAKRQHVNF